VTMSFDTNLHTMMGISPEIAVKTLADIGVDAVGANCGRGPAEMEPIMEQMISARGDDLLLIAQSNAGLPQLVGDRFKYDCPPAEMAAHALRLRELGVDMIGACCGSTPEHIAAMHAALSS
ncbi:MAG: homocysteine S-methyltransferase family protein, partial [Candidatus Nanopelagicales bacterium]